MIIKAAGVALAATTLWSERGATAALAATPTGRAPHAAESSSTSPSPSSQVGAPLSRQGSTSTT